MASFSGPELGNCKTALDLITQFPALYGQNGYYMLWPNGRTNPGQLVWCDMTTNGGGYMMIARSHPTTINYNGQKWGWQGGPIGSIMDFTQAYQAGWWTYWHNGGATFSSFIFGNRTNLYNNNWGPFIYNHSGLAYSTFITSDTQQSSAAYTTIQSNTSTYGSITPPSMQSAIGFPVTGTANNMYYMRDCCGFSPYGAFSNGMTTTYCSNTTTQFYSGPWCNGTATDASFNFIQGGSSLASNTGGTSQYMIMVR